MEPQTPGVELAAAPPRGAQEVLSPAALTVLARLHRAFAGRRAELIVARAARQAAFDAADPPAFAPQSRPIREGAWTVAPLPDHLVDRRVELAVSASHDGLGAALGSGVRTILADFEDAASPTFAAMVGAQAALRDCALNRGDAPQGGPTIIARPRGLHLHEAHVSVDGDLVPAFLFDVALFLFHGAAAQVAAGRGPCLSVPKLESAEEASFVDDVLAEAEAALGLAPGTVRVTILVETLPAAFALEEIVHALKGRAAGLDVGRRDAILSFVKTIGRDPARILPDRRNLVAGAAFLRALSLHTIAVAHRRGALALAGAADRLPSPGNDAADLDTREKLRADVERASMDGHDGVRIAHPDLVPVATEVFDRVMPEPNQLARPREDVAIGAAELFEPPPGERTEDGLRELIRTGITVLEAWLAGRGAVPCGGELADASTVEVCRAIVWQWVHHGARLADGRHVDRALVRRCVAAEAARLAGRAGQAQRPALRLEEAAGLFGEIATAETLAPFVTIPAYRMLVGEDAAVPRSADRQPAAGS